MSFLPSSINLRIAITCVATCPSINAWPRSVLFSALLALCMAKWVSTLNETSVHTIDDSTRQIAFAPDRCRCC
jgi:hypothetical protein